jgi:hypothetical protein
VADCTKFASDSSATIDTCNEDRASFPIVFARSMISYQKMSPTRSGAATMMAAARRHYRQHAPTRWRWRQHPWHCQLRPQYPTQYPSQGPFIAGIGARVDAPIGARVGTHVVARVVAIIGKCVERPALHPRRRRHRHPRRHPAQPSRRHQCWHQRRLRPSRRPAAPDPGGRTR